MGKRTGKPGPDPRTDLEKAALRLPDGSSFGGPSRPATHEVAKREEEALRGFFRKVGAEK
jgi:hypothetical protein